MVEGLFCCVKSKTRRQTRTRTKRVGENEQYIDRSVGFRFRLEINVPLGWALNTNN